MPAGSDGFQVDRVVRPGHFRTRGDSTDADLCLAPDSPAASALRRLWIVHTSAGQPGRCWRDAGLLVACTWLLAACAGTGELPDARIALPPADVVFDRLVLSSSIAAAPDTDVLAIPVDARRFLDEEIRSRPYRDRVRLLADAFKEGGALGLAYEELATRTATETYETRLGNCMSYSQLFVAMARELGVHVRFREERRIAGWTRVGDVMLLSRHMAVWGTDLLGRAFEANFGEVSGEVGVSQLISDERARAQHFNNLGAVKLVDGAAREAVPYLLRALMLDASLAFVWSNLGIALGGVGATDDAEVALLHALRLDDTTLSAASGLSRLYERTGDQVLARAYARALDRHRNRNPYYHFELGTDRLAAGEPERAIVHLRKAVRLKDSVADFHFELGRAYLLSGSMRDARVQFARTSELTADADQQRIYASQLQKLLQQQALLVKLPETLPPEAADGATVDGALQGAGGRQPSPAASAAPASANDAATSGPASETSRASAAPEGGDAEASVRDREHGEVE